VDDIYKYLLHYNPVEQIESVDIVYIDVDIADTERDDNNALIVIAEQPAEELPDIIDLGPTRRTWLAGQRPPPATTRQPSPEITAGNIRPVIEVIDLEPPLPQVFHNLALCDFEDPAQVNGNADPRVCAACLEKQARLLVVGCGHLCLCADCGSGMWQKSAKQKCPICRAGYFNAQGNLMLQLVK
jgi:hypothetical protein